MNLLITNTRNPQSYAVLRALKPLTNKIIATSYGNSLSSKLSITALSRYVDKVYRVPDPVVSWKVENIRSENSPEEERYVSALLDICTKELIDVIFPSRDALVFILSKNKARFAETGVLVPVPEFDLVCGVMDKYKLMCRCEDLGIPHPRTILPKSDSSLFSAAADIGYPLVIKPRFSTGSKGIQLVKNADDLRRWHPLVSADYGRPILQEYIPGAARQFCLGIYQVIDRSGDVFFRFTVSPVYRSVFMNTGTYPTASGCVEKKQANESVQKLHQAVGYYGYSLTDLKVDPRDGIPKVLEVNPRLSGRIWTVIVAGVNVPRMCLEIEQGKILKKVADIPDDVVFCSPVEEFLVIYAHLIYYMARALGRRPIDPDNAPYSPMELIASFIRSYRGKGIYVDLFHKCLLDDPLVSLVNWLSMVWVTLRNTGKFLRP